MAQSESIDIFVMRTQSDKKTPSFKLLRIKHGEKRAAALNMSSHITACFHRWYQLYQNENSSL